MNWLISSVEDFKVLEHHFMKIISILMVEISTQVSMNLFIFVATVQAYIDNNSYLNSKNRNIDMISLQYQHS
jgi:hypothetical protein